LGGTDGAERDGCGQVDAARLQNGEQVNREQGGDHRAQRDRRHQQGEEDRRAGEARREDACRGDGTDSALFPVLGLPRHGIEIGRQQHEQMEGGISEAGAAPAEMRHQESRQRPAHRAGETAEQSLSVVIAGRAASP
jgi:hypothetical protein